MDVIIKKGGILVEKETNEEASPTYEYLFDFCELDKDVTLKDIFLLLDKEVSIYHSLIGNWLAEIVDEGLENEAETDKEIEYLELYWSMEKDEHKGKRSMYGFHFPQFHGIGYEEKEDVYEGDTLITKKGERQKWAIEFTPTSKLVNIPIKLRKDILFEEWKLDKEDVKHEYIENYADGDFTLGNILYGIIYELSFCGSPKDRDEKREEIDGVVKDIKSGKSKCKVVDIDDLKKELGI